MASILKVDTIQDQDGNNIINENANVITVGASGDTVNIVGTLQNNGAAIPGDISSVVAGTGLSGGGTSGDVTLNIEAAQPTITSTGTLTNFTSTGIDDNATSTAITINSSEQVAFTDGTASLPSITNLGDENTGIFFPSADTIAFSEGGVEAMRIDSNGQLNTGKVVVRKDGASEIGQLVILNQSADSNADLHFKGYAYQDRARIRVVDNASSTSGGSMKIETAGYNSTDGSSLETRMLLDKNGNISFYEDTGTTAKMVWDATNERLGIGTSSPTEVLHVVGDILATGGDFKSDANNYLGFSNNTFARFVINDSEKMRITQSGNVGIGTSSPSSLLHIYSSSPQMIIQDSGTHGTDSTPGLVFKDTSSSQGEIGFENSGEMFIRQLKNSDMTFRTNNTERMRIY
jgi:trimeric autotransporter adhesin